QRGFLKIGFLDAAVPEASSIQYTAADIEQPVVAERMLALNFRMQDLSGGHIDFQSLKGKMIFLNLWASWCPPCRTEMPGIQKLYEQSSSEKVAFVMLSLDNDMEKIHEFLDKYEYSFPVYRPISNLPDAFVSSSIPSTFIISPLGEIIFQKEGIADYNTTEVKNLLMA